MSGDMQSDDDLRDLTLMYVHDTFRHRRASLDIESRVITMGIVITTRMTYLNDIVGDLINVCNTDQIDEYLLKYQIVGRIGISFYFTGSGLLICRTRHIHYRGFKWFGYTTYYYGFIVDLADPGWVAKVDRLFEFGVGPCFDKWPDSVHV